MKKRLISLVLAVILLLAMATPALAAAPKIRRTEYEGGKKVEVDFVGQVSYRNPKITVKDSSGKKLSARIVERDSDDIDFSVSGLKAGRKYTFTLSGVRAGTSGRFGTVKGSFSVPANVAIQKLKYDAEDRELEIDFNGKVKYKGTKVSVKDASGREYATRIIEKDKDDMEVKVTGLERGGTYVVTVSGVALKGGGFATVSKSFTVK